MLAQSERASPPRAGDRESAYIPGLLLSFRMKLAIPLITAAIVCYRLEESRTRKGEKEKTGLIQPQYLFMCGTLTCVSTPRAVSLRESPASIRAVQFQSSLPVVDSKSALMMAKPGKCPGLLSLLAACGSLDHRLAMPMYHLAGFWQEVIEGQGKGYIASF